jgi:hypothetical protein
MTGFAITTFLPKFGKPVIFLTQDDPASAPVDVRQFEFIHYNLRHHKEFLANLDNAIQNAFVERYRALYEIATDLLKRFNTDTHLSNAAAPLEDFQARVMRAEQIQHIPPESDTEQLAAFLIQKILVEATDVTIMLKVTKWCAVAK